MTTTLSKSEDVPRAPPIQIQCLLFPVSRLAEQAVPYGSTGHEVLPSTPHHPRGRGPSAFLHHVAQGDVPGGRHRAPDTVALRRFVAGSFVTWGRGAGVNALQADRLAGAAESGAKSEDGFGRRAGPANTRQRGSG